MGIFKTCMIKTTIRSSKYNFEKVIVFSIINIYRSETYLFPCALILWENIIVKFYDLIIFFIFYVIPFLIIIKQFMFGHHDAMFSLPAHKHLFYVFGIYLWIIFVNGVFLILDVYFGQNLMFFCKTPQFSIL